MPEREFSWPVYDIFETADNEKVFVGIVTDSQWRAFCEKFELSDWAQDCNLATNNQRIKKRRPKIREKSLLDKCDRPTNGRTGERTKERTDATNRRTEETTDSRCGRRDGNAKHGRTDRLGG